VLKKVLLTLTEMALLKFAEDALAQLDAGPEGATDKKITLPQLQPPPNQASKPFSKMSQSEFLEKLHGYKSVRPADLKSLTPHCYLIRYAKTTAEGGQRYYGGGLLQHVDTPLNRYIVLMNCANKKTWSVQNDGNVQFFAKQTEKHQAQSALHDLQTRSSPSSRRRSTTPPPQRRKGGASTWQRKPSK